MVILIVDQNMLNSRAGGIRDRLSADETLRVVIPDVAFIEMCKGASWELGFELSMKELAGFEDRIEMSLGAAELLASELSTGEPTNPSKVLPAGHQTLVRDFIRAFSAPGASELRNTLVARITEIRPEIESDFLDAPRAQERTAQLAKTWVDGLRREIISAVASPKTEPEFVAALIHVQAHAMCVQIARTDLGMSEEQAEDFAAQAPFVLRYMLGHVRHTLLAARFGVEAIRRTKAEKELNHQFDIEYALLATYFDGLMTNDGRALEAYKAVRDMLRKPVQQSFGTYRDGLSSLGLLPSLDHTNPDRE